MSRVDLKRLHWLREKRMERALEDVAARQTALNNAEEQLSEARKAVSERIQAARRQDAASFSQMKGKTISYAEITNYSSDRSAYAYQLQELRMAEKNAGKHCENAKAELKKATRIYRQYYIDSEKLQRLIKERTGKLQRRQIAFSEAHDDEFSNRRNGKPDNSQTF